MQNNNTVSLRNLIQENLQNKTAIGHFNFSTYDAAWAIVMAAKELNLPVILGLSEGERDFVGARQAASFVKSLKENFYDKVFLNADHTYTYEKIVEAVESGYDMVIYDGAGKTLEENIAMSQKCREFINKYNTEKGTDVLFEAELGYIGKSSQLLDSVPENLEMTKVQDALKFTQETNIDLLAPAVGNVHGMLKSQKDPDLDIGRIGEISSAVQIPLVLHGASGNSNEEIQNAIKNGVAIVHVNTEIRVAYTTALKNVLKDSEETAPYKYLKTVQAEVINTIKDKLMVFNFLK
jgi:fructose-bisphosphate aldolase class II